MNHRGNILQLGIKELRSLWHDKVLLLFVAFAFTGLVYVVSSATSQELNNAPIAFVDEDQSPLSKRIISSFYGPYFKTPDIISMEDIDPAMDNGSYTFVINIPPYFERDVLAGKQPDLQVNIDATRMTQAFIGDGYIQNIIGTEINEFVSGYRATYVYPVQLTKRIKFNPNLTSVWFGSVMELMDVITMISIILTGAAVIREREHGTLEHLLVMPVTPFEIVVAKIWSNGLVILLAAAFSLFVVIEGFLHVPIHGSAALFLFGAAIHLFATTSLGILIGYSSPHHASTRATDHFNSTATTDVIRRNNAQRKYARHRTKHYAGCTNHTLREVRTSDTLPRCRMGCGLALFPLFTANWNRIFSNCTGALS